VQYFRNGRGARGGRRVCISGGGGETKDGQRGIIITNAMLPAVVRKKKTKTSFYRQRPAFSAGHGPSGIRASSRGPYERRGGATGLDGTGLQAATGREGEAMGGVA